MIVFDLKCGQGHRFEAWFRDTASFEAQVEAGEIDCAVCGDRQVTKALMAPNITTGEGRDKARAERPEVTAELVARAHAAMRELRAHVEKTHEDVGLRFPEEVRRIHYGEAASRAIYGEASTDDAEALAEEGIGIIPIGPARRDA